MLKQLDTHMQKKNNKIIYALTLYLPQNLT